MFDAPVSVDDLAKAKGLKSYDTAIPQEWWDRFHAKTGEAPNGIIVWGYDNASVFGKPVALTDRGEYLLHLFDAICKCEMTANLDQTEGITYYDCGWDTERIGVPHKNYHLVGKE